MMHETRPSRLHVVLSQREGQGLLLVGNTLPVCDLSERGDRTFESHVNHVLRREFGLLTQIHRSLPVIDGEQGASYSVIHGSPIPEHVIWTPLHEALKTLEKHKSADTLLHFVTHALGSALHRNKTS